MANKYAPIEERLLSKVEKTDSCWIWKGTLNPNNKNARGLISYNGKIQLAHRVSYQLYVGKIPEGLLVCHTCDNGLCVNPSHLFLGTQRDNMQDASRKKRIHNQTKDKCKYGHPFSEENTKVSPSGYRRCMICERENKTVKIKIRDLKLLNNIVEAAQKIPVSFAALNNNDNPHEEETLRSAMVKCYCDLRSALAKYEQEV